MLTSLPIATFKKNPIFRHSYPISYLVLNNFIQSSIFCLTQKNVKKHSYHRIVKYFWKGRLILRNRSNTMDCFKLVGVRVVLTNQSSRRWYTRLFLVVFAAMDVTEISGKLSFWGFCLSFDKILLEFSKNLLELLRMFPWVSEVDS